PTSVQRSRCPNAQYRSRDRADRSVAPARSDPQVILDELPEPLEQLIHRSDPSSSAQIAFIVSTNGPDAGRWTRNRPLRPGMQQTPSVAAGSCRATPRYLERNLHRDSRASGPWREETACV